VQYGDCVCRLLGLFGFWALRWGFLITGVGVWDGSLLRGYLVGLNWIIESWKGCGWGGSGDGGLV